MNNKLKFLLIGGWAVGLLLCPMGISKSLAYYASEETLAARVKVREDVKSKYPELKGYSQAERIRRQEEYLAKVKETSIPGAESVRVISPSTSANPFLVDAKPSTGFII